MIYICIVQGRNKHHNTVNYEQYLKAQRKRERRDTLVYDVLPWAIMALVATVGRLLVCLL